MPLRPLPRKALLPMTATSSGIASSEEQPSKKPSGTRCIPQSILRNEVQLRNTPAPHSTSPATSTDTRSWQSEKALSPILRVEAGMPIVRRQDAENACRPIADRSAGRITSCTAESNSIKGGISPAAYDRPAFPSAPSEAYATIERSDMSTEVTVRLSRAIAMRSRASACPVSFKSVSVDPLTLITSSTNLPGVRFTSIARQETGMAKKAAKTIFFVTTFIFRDI